jgi:hypothetical protein
MKAMMLALAVTAGLLVARLPAQHEGHAGDTPAPANQTDVKEPGSMMSQMPMMMDQNETGKLVDQLAQSFAAISTETDPTALKAKLAEHGALLKDLQTKVQAQSHRMEMMQHKMGGPAKVE